MRFLNVICQKVLIFFSRLYLSSVCYDTKFFKVTFSLPKKKKKILNEEKSLLRRYTSLIREKETVQGY